MISYLIHRVLDILPDKLYLQIIYKHRMGKRLNLRNPKTFNEKIQWLKLYDRRTEYIKMVDKYEAKKYVASIIGDEYIIPTLGVWNSFDEIDFNKLPEQFVLKCTHDSGGLVIVKDKSRLDIEAAKKKLEQSLATDYYKHGREWPYKCVKRRIIAEKYLTDESGYELKDYKVFNFDGEPKLIQVDFDRFADHKRNLYDTDWNLIEAAIQYPSDRDREINRPEALDKMLSLARKLAKEYPHIRTDFYSIDDKIYFGELTLYHGSGFETFDPEIFGEELGKWIKIPLEKDGGVLLKSDNIVVLIKREHIENCCVSDDLGHIMNRYDDIGILDYKYMCFNGKVKCAFVGSERFSKDGLKITFFDNNWNRMPFIRHYPASSKCIKKPLHHEEMIDLTEKLCKDIPFARVDFYEVGGKTYFGEITLYPGSGFEEFSPDVWDEKIGDWITLPPIWRN